MRYVRKFRSVLRSIRLRWQARHETPVVKTLKWIKQMRAPGGGLRPTPQASHVTPEVTGYTIPTLLSLGKRELAHELAKWELSVQREDGGFEMAEIPHAFDTAQVARGFLAVLDEMPEVEPGLRAACDYVCSQISEEGEVCHENYELWRLRDGTLLSEYGNLYVLPPLVEAAERLSEPRWAQAATRAMGRFRGCADLVDFKPQLSRLSHYFGYMMEALVDLGETDLASKGLEQAVAVQRSDGAFPAYPGASWACSTGAAQLAIALYKMDWPEPADRAVDWLERVQNPTGGFYGGYGANVEYFPRREILWAAKFYLDALLHRVASTFDRDAHMYDEEINEGDPRAQAVVETVRRLSDPTVVDLGCGKGRYLRLLERHCPAAELVGVDISREMLAHCPDGVQTSVGSVLHTGLDAEAFDCVICIETLEHALVPENAIREMSRILRPGGVLLIIDKAKENLGRLEMKPWEEWFEPADIAKLLRSNGVECDYRNIGHGTADSDDLFVLWQGVKCQ